ncbi:MAG: DUF2914 domain-containing protein [Myxococcota bacterium]
MTRGSGGTPPDRGGKAFDAVWGELVGKDSEKDSEGEPKAPKLEAEAAGESDEEAAPEEPAGSGETRRASASELAQKARRAREAQNEMDWMMTVKPEASGFGKIIDPGPDRPGDAPYDDDEPDDKADEKADDEPADEPADEPDGKLDDEAEAGAGDGSADERADGDAAAGQAAADDDDDDDDPLAKTKPDIMPAKLEAEARAGVMIEPTTAAPKVEPSRQQSGVVVTHAAAAANERPNTPGESGGRGGMVWAVAAGVGVILALVLWQRSGSEPTAAETAAPAKNSVVAQRADKPTPPPRARRDRQTHSDVAPPAAKQAPEPDPEPPNPEEPAAPPSAVPPNPAQPEVEAPANAVEPPAEVEPTPVPSPPVAEAVAPPTPSSDPREPPAGTPPEIAAVFRKLPVSPADRAPVGGVGATGVHIDQISMGATYENRKCTGESSRFSIANGDRPSVCVRVVHQREKEELVVQWEKAGGATRRGKLHIKPAHAYRTRAYLMLRREYIGDWTVKVLSQDGVELAAVSFSVVP